MREALWASKEASMSRDHHKMDGDTSSNNTRDDSTHGHHQMAYTEIRFIIFFVVKDEDCLYSQQKQDWELTVGLIMNSL